MASIQQMADSNTSVEYTLLSPFRWLIGFLCWGVLLIAVGLVALYNETGWIANLGDRSQSATIRPDRGRPAGARRGAVGGRRPQPAARHLAG